jgi:hypothetical protein
MPNKGQIDHIDEEILERYALGKLDENDAAPLEEHLFVCHACQDRLADADAYIRSFRRVAPEIAAEPAKERWYERYFRLPKLVWVPAVAAMAVFAIVIQTTPTYNQTQVVTLRAYRGVEAGAEVEAGTLLELKLGTEGLKQGLPYRVEIVDAKGTKVWYGVAGWKDEIAAVNVPKPLGAGRYWVRLYDLPPESEVVREFGLTVR